ncbi:hypothetical protein FRC01_003415 [Tulasnella sp. 417]|nr:hypothetical protein FRC01_003415 [Tulasnella sp. 417]
MYNTSNSEPRLTSTTSPVQTPAYHEGARSATDMPPITIHDLPTEMLVQVLILTLPDDPWEWELELVRQLALVCRRWLGVVLSTPGLWPTVDLRQGHRTIAVVLARNPTGPLNVRLRVAPFSSWSIPRAPARRSVTLSSESFVDILSPYAQRWRNIDITGFLSTETILAIERAEAAEYLQLLVVGGFRSSAPPLVNISRLNRLQRLRVSGVQVQWDDIPKLPLLRILTISFTELPPIDQLHAMLESSTMLESISFHNIDNYPLGGGNRGPTSQRYVGSEVIQMPNLTNIHLNMIPTGISFHLLTHLACPGPLSLTANCLDQSVLQNDIFKQLVPAAITNFERISVEITPKGLRVQTDNGGCINDDAADADAVAFEDFLDLELTLAKLDQMTDIAQNLGLLLESKRTTLTVPRYNSGSLDTVRVAWDLIPVLSSIDDIWVVGGWTLDGVVEILLEKCLGELGDLVWAAPRLQHLAIQGVLGGETEEAVSALCRLWERRAMTVITINELPTEVLIHVLALTLPEDPWEWKIGLVQQLGLVCRRWLSIALSASELWPTVESRQSYRTIAAVLAHNRTGPLDVRVQGSTSTLFSTQVRRDPTPSTKQLVDIISTHSQRLKNIDIEDFLSKEIVLAIERAEATEHLQLSANNGSVEISINLSRLDRLHSLRISGVKVQWDNIPRLPLLQILTVTSMDLPRIHQLHAFLKSSTKLESISFHNIKAHSLEGWDEPQTSQDSTTLGVVQLPELTNIHLNMVPIEISTFLLTHLACTQLLSLVGNHLLQSAVGNASFKSLVAVVIAAFQRVRVDITSGCLRIQTNSADRIKYGTANDDARVSKGHLDLEFCEPGLDEMTVVAQNLGLLLESKLTTMAVWQDSVTTIRVATAVLPALHSVDDIWVKGGGTLDGIVKLLLEKCLGGLGDLVWVAPRLRYLAVQDVSQNEREFGSGDG